MLGPQTPSETRIGPLALDVRAIKSTSLHRSHRQQNIAGITRERIVRYSADHAANSIIGIDLVRHLDGMSTCQKLMVQALAGILIVFIGCGRHGSQKLNRVVNLVEREPVAHQAAIFGKNRAGILVEICNGLAVLPSAKFLIEIERRIKMPHSHQGLDIMRPKFLKDTAVIIETCLVGLILYAPGKDTAPADRHAKLLKAHLRH